MITVLKNFLQRYPVFLFTIPLFIAIHIEQQYHKLIDYQFAYRPMLWLFVPPFIVMPIAWLLFRRLAKAGIFAGVLLLVFYFFSDLKISLHTIAPTSFFTSYLFLLPLIALLLIMLVILFKKSTASFYKATLFSNLSFILFVMADLLLLVIDPDTYNKDSGYHSKSISRNYTPCDTCNKPDIYYLLFDAYTSSATLQTTFNYNNPIDSFLLRKKFYLINHSSSNYNLTPFSISSCFNLQYLQHVNTDGDFFMNNYMPGIYAVYKSELPAILEKEGYSIINHSIFKLEKYRSSVYFYSTWQVEDLYTHHNIFRQIDKDIGWLIRKKIPLPTWPDRMTFYTKQRDDYLFKTRDLLREDILHGSDKPRFIYAHFLLPHAPYSLDSSGHQFAAAQQALSVQEKQALYVQQVGYANKLIRELVENILERAQRPVVIVIQGDHGFRFEDAQRKKLQFSNLNAIYFSNQDYRLLYNSMTNVNTFRVVCNTFLSQRFPLLKDTSYFLNIK